MPAQHFIDDKDKLIITTWQGDATDRDFFNVLKEYQKNIQCKPEYIDYNEILDVSKANEVKVTVKGMTNIRQLAASTDHLFNNKRLALIVESKITFSIAKAYEMYRNMGTSSCKVIRVFKNKEKAIKWAKSSL